MANRLLSTSTMRLIWRHFVACLWAATASMLGAATMRRRRSSPKTPMGKSGKAGKAVDFSLSAWTQDTRNARREEERKRMAAARGGIGADSGGEASASGVKVSWAEREAEAFGRKLDTAGNEISGATTRRGFFARLFGGPLDAAGQDDAEDAERVGWLYMDDFGREQGPFSTDRMRAWMRKGFLTDGRQVRRMDVAEWRPLYEWPELDVMAVAQKARRRWKTATAKVDRQCLRYGLDANGRLHIDAIVAALSSVTRAVGWLRCSAAQHPYFRSTPPASWPPALVDTVLLACELASVDILSHIIGHFDGTNLGAELLIEILSLLLHAPPVRLSGAWRRRCSRRCIWPCSGSGAGDAEALRVAALRRGAILLGADASPALSAE